MKYICNTCDGYAYEIRTDNEEYLANFTFIRYSLNNIIEMRTITAEDFINLIVEYQVNNNLEDYEYQIVLSEEDEVSYIGFFSIENKKFIVLAKMVYIDAYNVSMDIDEEILKFLNNYFDSNTQDIVRCYKKYNRQNNKKKNKYEDK